MDLTLLILITIPALALGEGIRVNIHQKGKDKATVSFVGENIAIISDKERSTFKINDKDLKEAVKKTYGGYPTNVYLHSPTPWNDLYKTYNWDQVTRKLTPVKGTILGQKSEPVIVMKQKFTNYGPVDATFNAVISQSVQQTATSTWSKGGELTIGQEISYGINLEVVEVSGKTSMEFKNSWGKETAKSESVTVGSSSGVTITLKPGQECIAQLSATRCTLDVKVDYEATLSGDVAANFKNTYQGHHFWAYDIRQIQQKAGLPRTIKSSEVIKIGYYTDSEVKILNK